MSLPNKLTMLRVFLIPVFVALFQLTWIPHNYCAAWVVFVLACVTDMLDGRIARSRNLVSSFGVLMDPLADKLLVMAAMICFIPVELVNAVIVVVILSREFLVTSIRLVAAGKGMVIAADKWGKIKTVAQMIWINVGLLLLWLLSSFGHTDAILQALWILWAAFYILTVLVTALTVISGLNYVVKNRQLFLDA